MSFTPFIKPYPDGYEDFEVGGTPVTAEILNTNYDGFLLALNEFLPELEGMVEANPSEQATAGNLTKLKVGNSIYLIPSGGSGGSTVEWEQIQLTGTKIATITIDNVPVDVYAPSGGGSGDEVEWTQVLGSGTKIGTITINNTPIDVYAPTPIDVEANPSGSASAGDLTKLKVGSSIYSIPSGGSGGATDLSDLDDVTITNVQNGQILKWNSTTLKWENSNESGGGGTGGHTIIDENGNSMTARAGLQFVGADVSDDATNNKTIVDLASAGGIDGVFIDTTNVVKDDFTIDGTAHDWIATEDCIVFGLLQANDQYTSAYFNIDGESAFVTLDATTGETAYIPVKKGQTLTYRSKLGTYTRIKAYGIQTGTTHSKFQPVIYSTEEREIGVWTDGKPLYEKTFIYSNIASLITSMTFQTDLSNVDYSQISDGAIIEGAVTYKLPYVGNNKGMGFVFNNSSNNFLSNGNDSFTNADLYITLQYTKTTDTAGSGSWTPQGVPTHHYSTDEHIIGTWIDGKTLYEKTIDFGAIPNNTTKSVAHGINNLSMVVSWNGCMKSSDSFETVPSGENSNFRLTADATNISIRTSTSWNDWTVSYITIQYTKSS